MIRCSNLEKKKEKNKNQVLIKTKVSNRFCFGTQDTIEGASVFMIDSTMVSSATR
jgi:hypothetical protein